MAGAADGLAVEPHDDVALLDPGLLGGASLLDRADLRPPQVALRLVEAHAQHAPAGVADDHPLLDLLLVLVLLPRPHVPRPEGQARQENRGDGQGQSGQTLHGTSFGCPFSPLETQAGGPKSGASSGQRAAAAGGALEGVKLEELEQPERARLERVAAEERQLLDRRQVEVPATGRSPGRRARRRPSGARRTAPSGQPDEQRRGARSRSPSRRRRRRPTGSESSSTAARR